MTRAVSPAALAAAVFCCAVPAQAGYVLDDFSTSPDGQVALAGSIDGTCVFECLGNQPVLGGSREIFVEKTGQTGRGTAPIRTSRPLPDLFG